MGRAPCCEKVGLKRGRWTSEEDETLTNYIQTNGEGSWRSLPKNAGLLRCGKSCRLRWINYLRADLKRGNISEEEEEVIAKLHSSYGNRWSLIAGHLPGRTDNEIKNYWNSHLSRRIHTFRRFNGDGAPEVVEIGKVLGAPKRRRGRTSRSAMKRTLINVEAPRREKRQEKGGGADFATTPILDEEGLSSLTNPLDEEREIAGADGHRRFTTDGAALGEERESGISGLSYDAIENEIPGPYEGAESACLERESDLFEACEADGGYLGAGVVGPTGEVTGPEILRANEEEEKGASLAIDQEEWMGWDMEGMEEKLKEDEWPWLWESNNLVGGMEMEFELQNSYEAWLMSD